MVLQNVTRLQSFDRAWAAGEGESKQIFEARKCAVAKSFHPSGYQEVPSLSPEEKLFDYL